MGLAICDCGHSEYDHSLEGGGCLLGPFHCGQFNHHHNANAGDLA